MEPFTKETVRQGLDRVLDFLDVQRSGPDLPGAPLSAHFASYGIDEDVFAFLNTEIEAKLFPDDPRASPTITHALHGGAVLGVAIGLAMAQIRGVEGSGDAA